MQRCPLAARAPGLPLDDTARVLPSITRAKRATVFGAFAPRRHTPHSASLGGARNLQCPLEPSVSTGAPTPDQAVARDQPDRTELRPTPCQGSAPPRQQSQLPSAHHGPSPPAPPALRYGHPTSLSIRPTYMLLAHGHPRPRTSSGRQTSWQYGTPGGRRALP